MPFVGLLSREEVRKLNEEAEVDHVLRAAGRITGEKQFIIIGSQSLHGKYPDLPDDLVKSFEVDLMALKKPIGLSGWR